MNDRIKILHLEDSLLDSAFIRTFLADGGISYDYFLVDNKKDFLAVLGKESINIILSDYRIPGFEGNEALQICREKFPGIPFIFVSGVMGGNAAIESMLSGAMDYVLKSNPERLIPVIKRSIREHNLVQELVDANVKLVFQNAEKGKRAEELVLANRQLVYENLEKEKRAVELILAKEKAEESDRLKSAFLANMSHEIRTPMNGILGFAELLKEPGLTIEEQEDYLKIIEKSGARMLNIINNIVDISKIESGLMGINLRDLDINEKVLFIYNFFRSETQSMDLHLSIGNLPELKETLVKTDPDKLESILTNLVKNAIKYTRKGSIELGYEKKGEFIEFYVKDTGIGIPPDRQQAIFERFIQADISDKMAFQGAGLGLSISRAYVEMLGGKLWVESVVGKGSVFWFTIPYPNEPESQN